MASARALCLGSSARWDWFVRMQSCHLTLVGFQLSCLMTKAWQGRRMSAGSEAAEQENKQHGESSQQPDSHFFRIFFSVTLCYRRLVFPTHLHPLSHHIACYITSLDPFKTSGLSRISPISASRSFTRSRGHLTEWFWDGLGRVRFLPPSNPLQNLMCICLLRGHLGQFDPITWVQDR